MSRLERNFRPITEVTKKPLEVTNRHGLPTRNVLVDFTNLPKFANEQSADTLGEGIGVNLRGLNRRAGISQIGDLEITTGGMNPPERFHSHGDNYRWWSGQDKDGVPTAILDKTGNNLHIHLNTEEIAARLQERRVSEQPKAWAHELNQAIELAFLRHQMEQIQKPLNAGLTVVPHALEAAQTLLTHYSAAAHGIMELGINAGVMALHHAVPLAHRIQSFPLERTALTGLVSGKDVVLGLHSLVRPLPQKDM